MIAMHIERIFDQEFIEMACKHPKIWRHITDDFTDQEAWKPAMLPQILWLAPITDKGERMGVFMVYPITTICWEIHTIILPEFWGKPTLEAAHLVVRYIFENTSCTKLMTHVPVDNPLARRLAEKVGFRREYVDKKSIFKDGAAMDQDVLTIYKGEV